MDGALRRKVLRGGLVSFTNRYFINDNFRYGSGYLADVKGHKLMLSVCVGGMCVTTLLFGFSSNIYWAICVRLCQGLCLGEKIFHPLDLRQLFCRCNYETE